jgi:hypothetical protein
LKTRATNPIIYPVQQRAFELVLTLALGSLLSLGLGILVISKVTTQDVHAFDPSQSPASTALPAEIVIEDIFDRPINTTGITLVDWEGYMANPAIKFWITPPADAAFPATARLTAHGARLYFDLPSEVGANGPTKTITFAHTAAKVPVYLAIFPDRDSADENYQLTIQFQDAHGQQKSTSINIQVIDQDKSLTAPFKITLDFFQDQTGFFDDPQKRAIVQQAADDWAYFIDDMQLDSVPVGAEQTWIVNSNDHDPNIHPNATPYTGLLVYAAGIHTPELNSRGHAGGSFQTSQNVPLPLKRSGQIGLEIAGDYNQLGWFLTRGDDDWWQSNNFNETNDFYSIVLHEIGHTLVFHPAHTLFGQAQARGYIVDEAVFTYQGFYPKIDRDSHFDSAIDRASQRGAFGYEYHGHMAHGRWLITKLDLLTAQAIGYKLRPTSAFAPLSILTASLPSATRLTPYTSTIDATGGIPTYYWTVESGALPKGLVLDSFTGTVSGIPQEVGTFHFTVRVRDYDSPSSGVTVPLSITITNE